MKRMRTAGTSLKKRIVFLGSGNMAEALISGLVKSGLVAPANVMSTDPRAERLQYLKKKLKIATTVDNRSAAKNADVIFIAVKPQQMETLLEDIGPAVTARQLVISIAAGITSSYIERFLPRGTAVVRAMPNTPAQLSAGAIAVAPGAYAGARHMALAKKLFATAGTVIELTEEAMNAVTALSGSGPAYVFLLCEAMEKAGVRMGLSAEVARRLARQTVFGAGKMLSELAAPADELRRNVTSPGGTTAAAIEHMEQSGLTEIVCQALERAKDRARQLSK